MPRSSTLAAKALALAIGSAILTGAPLLSSTLAATPQAASGQQTAVFAIENMTCSLCPVTVKKAIGRTPGVKSVVIDFAAKTATVVFDPSKASVAAIASASTNAGYPARKIGG